MSKMRNPFHTDYGDVPHDDTKTCGCHTHSEPCTGQECEFCGRECCTENSHCLNCGASFWGGIKIEEIDFIEKGRRLNRKL